MDLLNNIHGNIQEQFYSEHLIPHLFATPEALLRSLEAFKTMLNDNQHYLTMNKEGETTDYIVTETQTIKDELIEMIDYVKKIYDYEDTVVPYQELRFALIIQDVDGFIKILKSILASVSYAIAKIQEGYFHSNVHLILKLLGFDILSEEMTNVGRIDAVIRFSDVIYIFEFKFGKESDQSPVALQQIKDKKYAEKFEYEKKDILLVGVSFGEEEKNINGYVVEKV
jgi:hypothetical protein